MLTAQQIDLEKQRHSLAHILAFAVKRLYPNTKMGIGPVTDTGFYYEFDTEHKFTHEDLEDIEIEMQKIIDQDIPFTNIIIPRDRALQTLLQLGETYKTELLNKIEDPEVSFYKTGEEFIDMCRGPHVKSTKELDNFKLIKVSKSYWLNDKSRPLLQKIVGVSFESKRKLEDYLENIQKLNEINSILIAEKLGLLKLDTKNKTSSPIWLKNGILLQQNIVRFLEEKMTEINIELVQEPWISNQHGILENILQTYSHNRPLKVTIEDEELVFRDSTESFLLSQITSEYYNNTRDHSLGSVFKAFNGELIDINIEKPKHLTDFMETTYPVVVSLTTSVNIKEMIVSHIRLIGTVLKAFGFSQFKLILETPDYNNLQNYLYDEKLWDSAISILKDIITDLKIPSKIREGGAEIYGPKLIFEVKDKYARNWEVSRIVLDMMLPKKLIAEEEKSSDELILIHTFLVDSIEKLLDLIFEHGEGVLPLWVEPEQVEIVPLESKYIHKAIKIARELHENRIRTHLDQSDIPSEEKISRSIQKHTPYILIIGEKEANTDSISVKLNGQDIGLMRVNEFIQNLETGIKEGLES